MMMEFVTYVVIHRSSMNAHRISQQSKNGVDEFLKLLAKVENLSMRHYFPYVCCLNRICHDMGYFEELYNIDITKLLVTAICVQ